MHFQVSDWGLVLSEGEVRPASRLLFTELLNRSAANATGQLQQQQDLNQDHEQKNLHPAACPAASTVHIKCKNVFLASLHFAFLFFFSSFSRWPPIFCLRSVCIRFSLMVLT